MTTEDEQELDPWKMVGKNMAAEREQILRVDTAFPNSSSLDIVFRNCI